MTTPKSQTPPKKQNSKTPKPQNRKPPQNPPNPKTKHTHTQPKADSVKAYNIVSRLSCLGTSLQPFMPGKSNNRRVNNDCVFAMNYIPV